MRYPARKDLGRGEGSKKKRRNQGHNNISSGYGETITKFTIMMEPPLERRLDAQLQRRPQHIVNHRLLELNPPQASANGSGQRRQHAKGILESGSEGEGSAAAVGTLHATILTPASSAWGVGENRTPASSSRDSDGAIARSVPSKVCRLPQGAFREQSFL